MALELLQRDLQRSSYLSVDPSELVTIVQKRLSEIGFDPGSANGVVGVKTSAAIRAFQTQAGLPVTGEVSEGLLDQLYRQSAFIKAQASKPPARTPRTKPSPPQTLAGLDFGAYHALVIGNNAYRSLPNLETAVNDAEAVGELLRDTYGFSVTVLKNVSRDQIIEALDRLRRRLTENDNLLLYYAGHGYLDPQADRGYWLPVDAVGNSRTRWLSNATITDTLKALKAAHVMVVADSCYSGTLTRSVESGIGLESHTLVSIERMLDRKSRTALTSGGLEPVVDKGGGGHSVFARAFLDALRDNDGLIDGIQLFGRVREQVRLNASQTPQYSNIRFADHEVGGDFLFVRKE